MEAHDRFLQEASELIVAVASPAKKEPGSDAGFFDFKVLGFNLATAWSAKYCLFSLDSPKYFAVDTYLVDARCLVCQK
jgi:hypothetical protein